MAAPHVWLREAIEAAAEITAWPIGMTGTAPPPFAIYAREGTARELLLQDELSATPETVVTPPVARFLVAIYADDYVQAWSIAASIREAVHMYAGTASGTTIESCMILDERDGQPDYLQGRETPTYTVEQSIEIRWVE